MTAPVRCAATLELHALPGLPIVEPGDDLAALLLGSFRRGSAVAGSAAAPGAERAAPGALRACDVVVVTSKLCSRAEGRFVDLSTVTPSAEAVALAARVQGDPALVELVLRESSAVSRAAPGALITRHRLGFVVANAGIDRSNARPRDAAPGSGPWALLLPVDPDQSAARLRAALEAASGVPLGVVITDSFGRPFREGTVGAAVGVAGLPALVDQRGRPDLFGRPLEHTITALADQVAAAADLVAGQSDEARPVVVVRGLTFEPAASAATALCRPPAGDLYA